MSDSEFHAAMARIVNSGRLVAVWVAVPDSHRPLPALVAPEHVNLFLFAKPPQPRPSLWARWKARR